MTNLEGAFVRRQEIVCTEDEMNIYANAVLLLGEPAYIKMNDGTIRQKLGDGVTRLADLPYTDNGAERVAAAADKAEQEIESAKQEAIDTLLGKAEESLGIVQGTGDSETSAMSQKATTNSLLNITSKPLNSVDLWEQGWTLGNNGAASSATNRMRTKTYLDQSVDLVEFNSEYWASVFAWDSTGAYVGVLAEDGAFYPNQSVAFEWHKQGIIDMAELKRKFPTYRFKINIRRTNLADFAYTDAWDKVWLSTKLQKNISDAATFADARKRNRRPMLTFIDDDCRSEVMDVWVPIIQEKGIPVTICAITEWVGKNANEVTGADGEVFEEDTGRFMTWDELATLRDTYGFEVVLHGKYHYGIDYEGKSVEQVAKEYEEGKRILNNHGHKGDYLVYSHSSEQLPEVIEAASRVFKCGFRGGSWNRPNVTPMKTYELTRYNLDTGVTPTLERFKGIVDTAVNENAWVVFMSHSQNATFTADVIQMVKDMIDYARAKAVDIVTVEEGMRSLGNVVDGHNLGISHDGKILASGIGAGVSNKSMHSYMSNAHEYEENLTREFIVGSAVRGFPRTKSGILETVKVGDYCAQTYSISDNFSEKWYRSFSTPEPNNFPPPFSPVGIPNLTTDERASLGFSKVGTCVFDTTLGKPVWVKTAGKQTVTIFLISGYPTASGNITLTTGLGTTSTIALTAGMRNKEVAEAIANATMVGHSALVRLRKGSYSIYEVVVWRAAAQVRGFCSIADTDNTGLSFATLNVQAGSEPVWVDATGAIV